MIYAIADRLSQPEGSWKKFNRGSKPWIRAVYGEAQRDAGSNTSFVPGFAAAD